MLKVKKPSVLADSIFSRFKRTAISVPQVGDFTGHSVINYCYAARGK